MWVKYYHCHPHFVGGQFYAQGIWNTFLWLHSLGHEPFIPHPSSFPSLPSPSAWSLWLLGGKVFRWTSHLTRTDCLPQHNSSAPWLDGMGHQLGSGLQACCQPLPTWVPAGQSAYFFQMQEAMGKSWQEIEVFYPVKNHRRPYFEFLTLTSMQECWSHSHLSDSRAGQLMTEYCLTLTLRSWRGHPLVSCEKLPLPGPWWEFVIISIGLNENLFVLTVKKVFMKLTRNINKNWRGILLLLMCLIC